MTPDPESDALHRELDAAISRRSLELRHLCRQLNPAVDLRYHFLFVQLVDLDADRRCLGEGRGASR